MVGIGVTESEVIAFLHISTLMHAFRIDNAITDIAKRMFVFISNFKICSV